MKRRPAPAAPLSLSSCCVPKIRFEGAEPLSAPVAISLAVAAEWLEVNYSGCNCNTSGTKPYNTYIVELLSAKELEPSLLCTPEPSDKSTLTPSLVVLTALHI